MDLTESLKQELEGMTPEYQDKLAHLLNTASSMGSWGGNHGELAVVAHDGTVVMCEAEATPLSGKNRSIKEGLEPLRRRGIVYCLKHKKKKVQIWPSSEWVCIDCIVEEISAENKPTQTKVREWR